MDGRAGAALVVADAEDVAVGLAVGLYDGGMIQDLGPGDEARLDRLVDLQVPTGRGHEEGRVPQGETDQLLVEGGEDVHGEGRVEVPGAEGRDLEGERDGRLDAVLSHELAEGEEQVRRDPVARLGEVPVAREEVPLEGLRDGQELLERRRHVCRGRARVVDVQASLEVHEPLRQGDARRGRRRHAEALEEGPGRTVVVELLDAVLEGAADFRVEVLRYVTSLSVKSRKHLG